MTLCQLKLCGRIKAHIIAINKFAWPETHSWVLISSTDCCEQLFSRMKLIKSKSRAQLTDGHLNDVLLLSVSSVASLSSPASAAMAILKFNSSSENPIGGTPPLLNGALHMGQVFSLGKQDSHTR